MLKLWILTTLLLSSCLSVFVVKAAPVDHHSFANIDEVYTNKLSLDLTVDFEQQQLHGFAESIP
jgi:hypothetical protein